MQLSTLIVFCAVLATGYASHMLPRWYWLICDVCDCTKHEVCVPTWKSYGGFKLVWHCYDKNPAKPTDPAGNSPCKGITCPKGFTCVVDLRRESDESKGKPCCVSNRDGPCFDPCSKRNCLHGGKCKRLSFFNFQTRCDCSNTGFEGPNCENNIDDCAPDGRAKCNNYGDCIDGINAFKCNCDRGFTGNRCQINIDDCKPDGRAKCSNHGNCVDGNNAFTCNCDRGFTGNRCQTNINDCKPGSCLNGGTCKDGINSFSCRCRTGFTGKRCATSLCPAKSVVDKSCSDLCGRNRYCKPGFICCPGTYKNFCFKIGH